MAKKKTNKYLPISKWLAYTSLVTTLTALYYKVTLIPNTCDTLDVNCQVDRIKYSINDVQAFNLYGWIPVTVILYSVFLTLWTRERLTEYSKTRARKKARKAREGEY